MCVISAYTVETSSPVFAPQSWPATSIKAARSLAQRLSERMAGDPRYPNAFWVIGARGRPVQKWFGGRAYAPSDII